MRCPGRRNDRRSRRPRPTGLRGGHHRRSAVGPARPGVRATARPGRRRMAARAGRQSDRRVPHAPGRSKGHGGGRPGRIDRGHHLRRSAPATGRPRTVLCLESRPDDAGQVPRKRGGVSRRASELRGSGSGGNPDDRGPAQRSRYIGAAAPASPWPAWPAPGCGISCCFPAQPGSRLRDRGNAARQRRGVQRMTSSAYPSLFSPLRIGSMQARNKVALAPMTVAYANLDGTVSHAEIEHYARRARGGVGLVITEHFTVSEAGRQLPRQTIVDSDRKIEGLAALAKAVHEEGTLLVAQIGHAGRYAGPWDRYEEQPRLAPSALPFRLVGDRIVTPTEMTQRDISAIVADIGTAAALLIEAGFDGVQLHASQGFLPSQFLSPRSNTREDGYGGSFANRIRFTLECLTEIRSRVGPDPIVGVQLLADEAVHDGWSLHEAIELAIVLESNGADFLVPSVTTFETVRAITSKGEARRWGHQLGATVAIQSAVSIPVIANGGITEPVHAERLLGAGLVAGVALARPLLADPDWAVKAEADDVAGIHRCACDPPQCLRTQLTGAICSSWPEARQRAEYWGRDESQKGEDR
ncbi:NADH:flavin oxidoreductase/NADH oxidase [Streptomyces hygroscopicus subsp. jinggangensis 5008]|nr:NADH:flavin oxidoreductase/NADH oxidase [Streptomyces hygroscopicus subsp. jinggangensis 5008]